ncbi:glutamate racemase [Suttonella ornithocola]|uniref:Glutamate racemase n=1 Tax=Suttonella ornithocola TaxID=279832 RepID=A0A380MM27_9GAMM|nr:glutamate racemase [Suttonella ornithocola]SUO93362.1 Glutamate racemase [Suttonella ornithocola]
MMIKNNAPIGLFDSGIGGTSVWREIQQRLPSESTILIADSANAPYGERSHAQIIDLCCQNCETLLDKGCKLIVVACNTATTNAIQTLRARYKVPFVGIEPAVKPAAIVSHTRKIGILATKGTLSSDFFHQRSAELIKAYRIQLIEQCGTGIVERIEAGKLDTEEMREHLQYLLAPLLAANIDMLVLGCTHYPYLRAQLRTILPMNIKIVDAEEAVARQTARLLAENDLLANEQHRPEHQWFSTGEVAILKQFVPEYCQVDVAPLVR